MKLLSMAAAATLALSGCSGVELERTGRVTPSGSEFSKALFSEYLSLSRIEYNEGDYGNSDVFALKARSVSGGTVFDPDEVATRKISPNMTQDVASARGRLVAALRGGARDRVPRDAAQAQALFECWIEELEENRQPDDIAFCRTGFMAALAKIEGTPVAAQAAPVPAPARPVAAQATPAAAPARPVAAQAEATTVYFDHNKATLDDEARRELDRIVARARVLNAKSVMLVGHADRSGSDDYNMRLSQSRVATVHAAIQRTGINVQFSDSAVGESQPAVQTADGVRERLNRGVTVRIVP